MHFEVSLPRSQLPGGELHVHNQNATPSLQHSLNRMLPRDVRVYDLELVHIRPLGKKLTTYTLDERPWHAMGCAKGKLYSYRFSTSHAVHPLQRFTRTHVTEDVDIDQLRRVLQYFSGTHEFRPFAGMVEQNAVKRDIKMQSIQETMSTNNNKRGEGDDGDGENSLDDNIESPTPELNTVRTIYKIDFVEEMDDDTKNYRIDFYIEGALYKMIRNIVGSAWEASKTNKSKAAQRMTEEDLIRILYQIEMSSDPDSSSSMRVEEIMTQTQPTGTIDKNIRSSARAIIYTRKSNLAKPAPPEGLTLEWVFFDEDELRDAIS
jgi:tRNA U38,U39,U40 pseudouridine synthase TruA